jgi:A/G-specific adenine glycosylase
VASFAFGQRHPVVDTNVRRVLARAIAGVAEPGPPSTAADLALAEPLLPAEPATAAQYAVAVMELGALVCTADRPRCDACPVVALCAWHTAGRPAYDGPPRPVQTYAGTDRQCRGRLLAVLRDAAGAVPPARLDAVWDDAAQRARCLESLLADGLAVRTAVGDVALP